MQRLLALVEVLAILLGANALARVVLAATGVGGRGPALPRTPDEPFDWLGTGLSMAVRWGIALSMAFAVCRLRRSGGLAAYGLTLAGRPLSSHLKLGLLTAAVSFLPAALLLQARIVFNLPGGPSAWMVFDAATRDADFWAFMLASSILLPPLFEEAYFRGYAQTRLTSSFGAKGAVLAVAVLFTLAHLQYLDGTLLGSGMVVVLLWQTFIYGMARMTSGSLLAPILAHAVANVPLRYGERTIEIAVLAVTLAWGITRERSLLRSLGGR